MHEPAVADVDADVLVVVEEDKISNAKVTTGRVPACPVLVEAHSRQADA
jgi:hypothetical protein